MAHAAPPRRRYLIHLDVNKTIIMIDPAANATARDVLSALIANNIWG
jgi:DNA recombination-dependent growth factor C